MHEYVKPPHRNPAPPDSWLPPKTGISRTEAMMEIARQIGRLADAEERNATAMERQAEATLLLARATAGEFDEPDEVPEPAPRGRGMGMG